MVYSGKFNFGDFLFFFTPPRSQVRVHKFFEVMLMLAKSEPPGTGVVGEALAVTTNLEGLGRTEVGRDDGKTG